jgi:hypothetical protein
MKLEKYETIEAYNMLMEDLMLQKLEFIVRKNNNNMVIHSIKDDIASAKDEDLKFKNYYILDVLIEGNCLNERSILALNNNQKYYSQRLEKILKGE